MNVAEFINYFNAFYHPKIGMYPMDAWTTDQLELAIKLLGARFVGDSFDRERIRDILMLANNKLAPR